MPTTDEALNKKRQAVEELRAAIKAAEAETARLMREKENDSTSVNLDAEIESLQAQLAMKHQEVTNLGGHPDKIEVPKAKVTRGGSEMSDAASTVTPPPSPPEPPVTPAKAASKTNGEG